MSNNFVERNVAKDGFCMTMFIAVPKLLRSALNVVSCGFRE